MRAAAAALPDDDAGGALYLDLLDALERAARPPDPYDADHVASRIAERWADLEGRRQAQLLEQLQRPDLEPDAIGALLQSLEDAPAPDPAAAELYRLQGQRFLDSWRAARVAGRLTFTLPDPRRTSLLDRGQQTDTRRGDTRARDRHARAELVRIGDRRRRDRATEQDEYDLWSRLCRRWRSCGLTQLYRNADSGTIVGLPDHCNAPLCPYCERRRLGQVRDRYQPRHDEAMAAGRVYFAVLTTPNVPLGELAVSFDRLRKAVRDLQRQRWFRSSVTGGLWRLELTVNLEARTWHPHVNLVIESADPLELATWRERLQTTWRGLMGATSGEWVWLQPGWHATLGEAVKRQVAWDLAPPLEDPDDPAGSSLGYAVKGGPASWIDSADPAWVLEYVTTQRGRRQVSAWGSWRGLPPAPLEHSDEATVWAPDGPADSPFAPPRRLPESDPITGELASWEWAGMGPRWALRSHRAAGARSAWLVWAPGDDGDPLYTDDDDLSYRPLQLVLGRDP